MAVGAARVAARPWGHQTRPAGVHACLCVSCCKHQEILKLKTTETLKKLGLAYTWANYDTLCLKPSRTFPELARFTGLSWSSKQLQYWEKEHHGLGGNGAALNNLANTPYANPRTADEGFYRDRLRQSFYDQRWRTHQSADQWDSLCRTSRTDQILAKCKTSLNLIDSQAGSLNQ